MARDAMKDEPLAPTMIAAWTFQVLFLAALVWDLASEPLYLASAGLSLQFLTELVAALPFGLSAIWLAGAWRGRGRGLRPPVDPLVFAIDLVACVSIAIFLGAGAWIWIGGRFDRIDALGGMPLLLFIAYVAVAPALSGLVWLILRTAGGDAQRLGLRNADQAAAKRSAHL